MSHHRKWPSFVRSSTYITVVMCVILQRPPATTVVKLHDGCENQTEYAAPLLRPKSNTYMGNEIGRKIAQPSMPGKIP